MNNQSLTESPTGSVRVDDMTTTGISVAGTPSPDLGGGTC